MEAQQFDREAERIEAWLAFHEPQVEIKDLSDDMAAVNVEELIKKHSALEKMLAGQEERLRNLDDHAERLVTGDAIPPINEAWTLLGLFTRPLFSNSESQTSNV